MFDEEPDGDPHGECAKEIHDLQAVVEAHKQDRAQDRDEIRNLSLKVKELEKAAEGGLRITCDNAYHDRGHGICSFCVQKLIDDKIKDLVLRNSSLNVALKIACENWRTFVEDELSGTDGYEEKIKEIIRVAAGQVAIPNNKDSCCPNNGGGVSYDHHAWTPINLSPGFDSQCKRCGLKADFGT